MNSISTVATSGVGIDATAATTDGVAVADACADTVGAGMDAVAATTDGDAVVPESTETVGDGIDAVADTTVGVAVASVPPVDGRNTVMPTLLTIAPDATWFCVPVAALLDSTL
ncbi:hypothetical protein ACFOY2_05270 [Nonomuraea purpurea]|uniref:Uncharacterized protein n=1 Tax=Nonomuraea purpurea TaxID=1849276 RepID=A0ABV8FXY1_9ACTN